MPCVEKRLAALEPIIFCVSVFLFGAGEKARFFVSSRSWAFFEAPEAMLEECVGETPGKTVTLYIILNIEKGKKHEIHFSV